MSKNMEIKLRYTWRRKSDGKIEQDVCPIEEIEKDRFLPDNEKWGLVARDLWTGFTDKEDTEIYVGDLFGNDALRCEVVRENDGAYKLHFVDKRIKPISILDHKIKSSKVKGNIHTHPELITKQGE